MNCIAPRNPARALSTPPEGAELLRAIPDLFPRPDLRQNGQPPAAIYEYRNADGSLAAMIARIESVGGKRMLPATVWQTSDGGREWCSRGLSDNRPLYRLPELLAAPEKMVLISEGEKCANAATIFSNYVSVTWMGGSKAISKTDFGPLAGRNVIILPDHDKSGQQAAAQLEQLLRELRAASVRRLDIARLAQECGAEPRPGFDIADAISHGLDAARFEALLATPGMLTKAFSAAAKTTTVDPGKHAEDQVQREILERFGMRPEDITDVFSVSAAGVVKHDMDRNGRATKVYAGSPLVVIGRTRAQRDGWGYRVALRTPDCEWTTLTIPAHLLAGDGRELRGVLGRAGAILPQCRNGRQALAEFIGYASGGPILNIATRPGWHGENFVLPDRFIGPVGADKIQLDMGDRQHFLVQAGTMANWQELARHAEQSSRAAFVICAALAAPLLTPLNRAGFGVHLFGQSSRGKTTLLTLAGSVWGGGGNDGFVRNWRVTSNGAEGLLCDHNDLLLPLDELTTVAPETAAELYYLLANGHGKVRATREGEAREAMQSRVLVLSSGENSAAQQIAQARGRVRLTGGMAVRMVDLPIEHAPGEAFENLAGFDSAGQLAETIAVRAESHYGHAGPAFVQAIVERRAEVVSAVEDGIARFLDDQVSPGDDPQVRRVAERFGLIAAAGRCATEFGILPWAPGSAFRASERCFQAWRDSRGGGESHEERDALSHLKAFFEAHGRARFERLHGNTGQTSEAVGTRSDDHAIRDRCGYRAEFDGEGTVFYVLPEAFRREVCAGHNPDLVIRIARSHGALIEGEGGRPQKKVRLPDYPSGVRVYALRPDLLP